MCACFDFVFNLFNSCMSTVLRIFSNYFSGWLTLAYKLSLDPNQPICIVRRDWGALILIDERFGKNPQKMTSSEPVFLKLNYNNFQFCLTESDISY